MSPLVRTYLGLFLYALRLSLKGIANRPAYLVFAPVASIVMAVLTQIVAGLNLGIAGGFLLAFVRAMALSAVLFAARAIVEQRRMAEGEVGTAVFAFMNDLMTVFFALWIASLVVGSIAPQLMLVLLLGLVVVPVFETVAFGHAGGFGTFVSAWSFFRRDLGPWLVGQLPVVAAFPLYLLVERSVDLIPLGWVPGNFLNLARIVIGSIPSVFVIVALVYRGILYLTLDGMSPRRRAEKFGGVTPLA